MQFLELCWQPECGGPHCGLQMGGLRPSGDGGSSRLPWQCWGWMGLDGGSRLPTKALGPKAPPTPASFGRNRLNHVGETPFSQAQKDPRGAEPPEEGCGFEDWHMSLTRVVSWARSMFRPHVSCPLRGGLAHVRSGSQCGWPRSRQLPGCPGSSGAAAAHAPCFCVFMALIVEPQFWRGGGHTGATGQNTAGACSPGREGGARR